MSLVFAFLSVIAAAPQTYWVEARNFGEGVEIVEAGKYTLWVWADVDKAVTVKLGEEEIALEAKPLPENAKGAAKYRWEKVGERELPAGKLNLAAMSQFVYEIVLTADAALDPVKANKFRRV